MKLNKELIDQTAHVVAAVIGLAPAFMVPNALSGAWAGFCMGYVRELTEEGDTVDLRGAIAALGSWKDLLFWTLGGAFTGMIF